MGRKKKPPLERKYFGMLPHCVWQLGLPPLAILVYIYIKKRSGEHGYCSEGAANMAKNIGISEGSVSNAKAQLKATKVKGKALITISKKYIGYQGRPCDFIKVANIWEENTAICEITENLHDDVDIT